MGRNDRFVFVEKEKEREREEKIKKSILRFDFNPRQWYKREVFFFSLPFCKHLSLI